MPRAVAVRIFELMAIYGPFVVIITSLYVAGILLPEILLLISFMAVAFTGYMLWSMPTSCRLQGDVIQLCTPMRCKSAKVLEHLEDVKGGRIPPGKTYVLFCSGWRSPTTLFSSCEKELFFSTPACDGRWRRWKGRVDGREKEIWICGCKE